jgi:hypothetical protein
MNRIFKVAWIMSLSRNRCTKEKGSRFYESFASNRSWNLEIVEIPIPHPGPGQILMRVEAVATCPQWDLHLRHNEPMFIGHTFHIPMQWVSQGMKRPVISSK